MVVHHQRDVALDHSQSSVTTITQEFYQKHGA